MSKKTAVEWFNDEILIHLNFDQRLYLKDIFNQAKEMEWEYIIDTYIQGCEKGEMFNNENRAFITDATQYYNETFKSE
jgi:hypothetical protein